jgi:hypothetical protein
VRPPRLPLFFRLEKEKSAGKGAGFGQKKKNETKKWRFLFGAAQCMELKRDTFMQTRIRNTSSRR